MDGKLSRAPSRLLAACFVLICSTGLSCGGGPAAIPPPHPGICDANSAPELVAATVQNVSTQELRDYAVAVALDNTNFDFTIPSSDGTGLAVWDSVTKQPLPFWLESYNASVKKALLWVKLPALARQGSETIWLTAGVISHCSPQSSNGYAIFPFYSDATDISHWTANNGLSLTNTVTTGPLSVQDWSTITSDGTYNGSVSVAEAADGEWVLVYRKGTNHVNVPFVAMRRSPDHGQTWSPEVVYLDTSSPDPSLVRMPGGDLFLELAKQNSSGVVGAAYSRSIDNGLTWAPFTFFDDPVNNTAAFPTAFLIDGTTMYAASYGRSTTGGVEAPFLWHSSDDGITWIKDSELRSPGEPDLNETAIAEVAPGTLFAIMRTDDSPNTYARYTNDMGMTWGSLLSYTEQVGAIHLPQLVQVGPALILLGREAIPIPGLTANVDFPRQLVAFVSYDGGHHFGYGTVLDTYTGFSIDGGYCWPMLLPNGQVYVVYYADTHDLHEPDIRSLILSVGSPQTAPTAALHVVSQIAPGLATHEVAMSSTRYALEFRFRSREIPAGSQFVVGLQSDTAGANTPLVEWELPSTHAADPRFGSGFIANGEFVSALDNFTYDHPYRIRTLVDETSSQQDGQILDEFGALVNDIPAKPLAAGTAAHLTSVVIGNNSPARATDSLLDFIFLRPVAEVEPTVTISRVR